MAPLLFAALGQYVLGFLLFVTSIFLILLVLVQRGRGGGLTGALGGVGGQSAFGTKAGDLFTKVTVVVACLWILLCMLTIITLNGESAFRQTDRSRVTGATGGDAEDTEGGALEAAPGDQGPSTAAEGKAPEGKAPAGKAPEGKAPAGDAAPSATPDSVAPAGETPAEPATP